MPKKKAAPKKKGESTRVQPSRRKGWLICDRCSTTLEFIDNGADGWPQHRCVDPTSRISEIRPFTTWSDTDPKPPLPKRETPYPAGWL
jgi:hypothetical protein